MMFVQNNAGASALREPSCRCERYASAEPLHKIPMRLRLPTGVPQLPALQN
jgi:hypothetical protein